MNTKDETAMGRSDSYIEPMLSATAVEHQKTSREDAFSG